MNEEINPDAPVEPRRSSRPRQRPDYFGVWVNSVEDSSEKDPTSAQEAISSSEGEKWKKAMNEEMKSMESNDAWELVDRPKGKKTIGCKWVYKRKRSADGGVERYKARLVAKGYSQQYGLDYDETFSPVARFESLRTILALAVQCDFHVHQIDVTTAFLNAKLCEEVHMEQPEGYAVSGRENHVCKLKHSIYGLKQAPRCWNVILDQRLKELGFTQVVSDPCIYVSKEKEPLMIGIYVDDILFAGKNERKINEIKTALSAKFDVKDLGELRYFLGVNVVQNHENGTTWIGQPVYTESVLKKFGMENCKSIATPVDVSVKLTHQETEDSEYVDASQYQSMVGSLLYLSMKTRPDIAFAVSRAARFCSKPTHQHLIAVKRILRYLQGTIKHGLLYQKSVSKAVIGYSDADWGGDTTDCKSTSGYLFQIGGTAISWQSKKQSCVSLSTAEYVALAGTTQEALWLKQLNADLTGVTDPITVDEDNQSAIAIAKNPQFHGRVKHINIKYHFLREQVNSNNIELKYCKTSEMIADMLTKGLSRIQFEKLRRMVGVKCLTDQTDK